MAGCDFLGSDSTHALKERIYSKITGCRKRRSLLTAAWLDKMYIGDYVNVVYLTGLGCAIPPHCRSLMDRASGTGLHTAPPGGYPRTPSLVCPQSRGCTRPVHRYLYLGSTPLIVVPHDLYVKHYAIAILSGFKSFVWLLFTCRLLSNHADLPCFLQR